MTLRRKAQANLGWNFKLMRGYTVGQHNDVTHVGNPVYNHKVEQIVRAVCLVNGYAHLNVVASQASFCDGVSFQIDALHNIGIIKANGQVQLHPDAVTALAILGMSSGLFLWYLGTCRIIDEIKGIELECIVNDGKHIYAPLNVLIQVARDLAFNYLDLSALYEATKRV